MISVYWMSIGDGEMDIGSMRELKCVRDEADEARHVSVQVK